MLKHILRSTAVASGALVAMAAYASPAAAEEVVPSGCAGTIYYACTGTSGPYPADLFSASVIHEVPVTLTTPSVPLVPPTTVGGDVGGMVVVLGGETVPGASTSVGGPTDPIETGVVTPVQVCAFVVCYPAGTPVAVPGFDLPLIPVVIPPTTLPSKSVEVPLITTVPMVTTPSIGIPSVTLDITVGVWYAPYDYYTLAWFLCEFGGGEVGINQENSHGYCSGGDFESLANFFFEKYGAGGDAQRWPI